MRRHTPHNTLGVNRRTNLTPGWIWVKTARGLTPQDRGRRAARTGGVIRSPRRESEVGDVRYKDVRYSAWCLATSLLVCVSASQAQVGGTNAQDRPTQSNPATADWKKNLRIGPNGPIPAIVVDQFGYLTKSKKVAVIRDPQIGYDNSARFTPGKI